MNFLHPPSRPARLEKAGGGRYQTGFLSQRTWGLVAVLVALMYIPYWLAKSAHNKNVQNGSAFFSCFIFSCDIDVVEKLQAKAQAERSFAELKARSEKNNAKKTEAITAAVPSPDRFGLSFGHGDLQGKSGIMFSACAGTPLDMGNPNKSQCNPYQGDSSCRTTLPLLCVLKDGSTAESAGLANTTKTEGADKSVEAGFSFYAGWAGGTLGATAPVAGFVIGSLSQANARCTAELGAGWRMAEFHDANGGWGLVGKRGQGLTTQQTRHWVHINDQKANCWDAEVK